MSWLDDEHQARRIGRSLQASALQTRDVAEDHLTQFARQTRAIAQPLLHQAADYARHEGAELAEIARKQAARAGRAVKADPVPAIVGAIGLAMLASLVMSRRKS